jgi:hypothetical protein
MGKYPYFPKVKSEWNKQQTFDGITIKEVTTPSENPPANYMKLYFKADGKLYKLNSSGAETVSNSTVSAITQALLDAKANINNPTFTGVVTIPNISNLETAVTANTAKTGITSGQASAIVANTAKTGITSGQSSAIVANTAKVSLDDNSVTLSKLAHGTADKYLGFDGSGVPAELTVSGGVPSGCILMWSGAIVAIPATWYLCDGTNGTPNLSNKFIRSGSSVGSTGGADTVTLTTAQLASHNHTQNSHNHTQDSHNHTQDGHGHNGSTNTTGAHTHTVNGWSSATTRAGRIMVGNFNGGSASVDSAGNHSHTVSVSNTTATNQATTATNQAVTATNQSTTASNQAVTATNNSAGSGSSHENMPAYYTLAYIMKA